MKSPRTTPTKTALLIAGRAQRKQEKDQRKQKQQQLIDTHAAKVEADVAAGILPLGTSRCLPWDRHGLRTENHARREIAWHAPGLARTEKRAARAAAKAATAAERLEKKQARTAYDSEVRALTEHQLLHLVPGIQLRGKEYALDHICPVSVAYRLGWTVEEAANVRNLQILTHRENFTKSTRAYSSLESRRLPLAAAA